ncbi:PREDICTED: uncharacterized protein LOC109184676 isoform X2 [Ipomoea nil]|uniref:uncharacterized protein LOC109184676 isoform X2 n=1 Tax=Ipomoea nil TaxID=35883 RepID=UPI000900919E|nr:PREDICTED: uncharacterized protein LOC109184676 isoform X2 [Ipomoea nil]
MDVHRERPRRSSVPQFGGWDQKKGGGEECTNYTLVFTQAREDRKQHKSELPTHPPPPPPPHISAFSAPPPHYKQQHYQPHHHQNTTFAAISEDASLKRKKWFLSYFSCFRG